VASPKAYDLKKVELLNIAPTANEMFNHRKSLNYRPNIIDPKLEPGDRISFAKVKTPGAPTVDMQNLIYQNMEKKIKEKVRKTKVDRRKDKLSRSRQGTDSLNENSISPLLNGR